MASSAGSQAPRLGREPVVDAGAEQQVDVGRGPDLDAGEGAFAFR